jgi:NADH-quinone oxidoreductase subunit N
MLLIAFRVSHRIIQLISLLLYALAFLSLVLIQDTIPHQIAPLLIVDGFSVFITGLIIFSGFVINILSYIYFEEKEESPKEYYVLLFLATLGASTLAVSMNFISLFLGLEILSVSLYALIAYLRARVHPIEASIKYLVLAAFSSAFLLFGMALIYLITGSMEFTVINERLNLLASLSPLVVTGLGMMLVGIGFKLAVVPFHLWAADVYQGAPAPITAFIATASKGGVLAVLLRFFVEIDGFRFNEMPVVLLVIAIASMLVGNLLALQQRNVKRILAYSSIAHLGYLLVAFVAANNASTSAITFYLLTYFLSSLTAFGIITLMSGKESDAEDIAMYKGLFWRKPILASIFTASLLSLAGIPLTAGFIGKFYIISAGLRTGLWISCIILVISSVVGLYYYLRIITTMFSEQEELVAEEKKAHPLFYIFSSLTLSFLTIAIVWLGINPEGFISFISVIVKR